MNMSNPEFNSYQAPAPEVKVSQDILNTPLEELYEYKEKLLNEITEAEAVLKGLRENETTDLTSYKTKSSTLRDLQKLLAEVQGGIDKKQKSDEPSATTLGGTTFTILPEEPERTRQETMKVEESLDGELARLRRELSIIGSSTEEGKRLLSRINEIVAILDKAAANIPKTPASQDIWAGRS